jgi:hypothetical protein
MIKALKKLAKRSNIPRHDKGCTSQIYSQSHTKQGKHEVVSSKVRNKIRVSTLLTVIYTILEFLARAIRQEKEIKATKIVKGKSQIIPICKYT